MIVHESPAQFKTAVQAMLFSSQSIKATHHRFSHGFNPLLSSVRIRTTLTFSCVSEDCCHHHIQIYYDMLMCYYNLCSVYSLTSLLAVGIQKQRIGKFYSAHITVSSFICWCTKHYNDPCELPLLLVLSSITIYLQDRWIQSKPIPQFHLWYVCTFRAWSRIISLWCMSKFITLSRNCVSDRIYSQLLPEFHLWHVGTLRTNLFQNSICDTWAHSLPVPEICLCDIWVRSKAVSEFRLCDIWVCSEAVPQFRLCDTCVCSEPVLEFHSQDTCTFRAWSRIPYLWQMGTFRTCLTIPSYDATVHTLVRSEPVPEFHCCDTLVRSEPDPGFHLCAIQVRSEHILRLWWRCMDKLMGWHVNWMYMHGVGDFISCSCPPALYISFFLVFSCRQDLALSAMISPSLNTRSLPAELLLTYHAPSANDMYLFLMHF